MKVAFATTDGATLDVQLRRAPMLVVYDVTPAGWCLERVSAFRESQRSADRIAAATGVEVVFVPAIGPSTAARLAMRGIRPATAPAGSAIVELLDLVRTTVTAHEAATAPRAATTWR